MNMMTSSVISFASHVMGQSFLNACLFLFSRSIQHNLRILPSAEQTPFHNECRVLPVSLYLFADFHELYANNLLPLPLLTGIKNVAVVILISLNPKTAQKLSAFTL